MKQACVQTHLVDLVNICAHVIVRNHMIQAHEQLVALCQRLPQRVTAVITPLFPDSSCGRQIRKVRTSGRGATRLAAASGVVPGMFRRRDAPPLFKS